MKKTNKKPFAPQNENCEITAENNTLKQEKRSIRIISSLITIISIALIIYTLINSTTLQKEFSSQVQSYGIPSILTLSILLDLIPQLISPIIILAASLVAGVNTPLAIIATIVGSSIGSIIGFALGKKYMCKAVTLLSTEPTRKRLTHLTNKYGKIIVPLAAISPLPYLPVLLGAMNLSKKNFLIYGLIPRALSFIIFGYLIKTI